MVRDQHLHRRMVQLAQQLPSRTIEGKISWSATNDEKTFAYSATDSSARISSYIDNESDDRTTLAVLNAHGTVFEDIECEFMAGKLYYAARRSALNVDGVLDGLMADLGSNDAGHGNGHSDDGQPF